MDGADGIPGRNGRRGPKGELVGHINISENVSTNTVFWLVGSSRGSWYRW